MRIFNKREKNQNDNWRLLGIDVNNVFMNMAIDEAIMHCRAKGEVQNTIRFYQWHPSAVSIGYFQSVEKEVNIDFCRKMEIDIIRRITGGGAVYHDYNGEIAYSLIVDEKNPIIPADILKSYEVICKGLEAGLRDLGVEAEFSPINDIVVKGKKISGNAQTRRYGVLLQHGTVLIDSNISTMFNALRISDEKISDKIIKNIEDRVTNLRRLLYREIAFEEVFFALKSGFEKTLQISLQKGDLTDNEQQLAFKLEKKFLDKNWIFRR